MLYPFFALSLILFANACNVPQKKAPLLPVAGTHSNFNIKGICLVAPVHKIDSAALGPLVNTNCNSVTIMPYAFCRNDRPEVMYNHNGQWWGETDAGVSGTIQLVHEKNLSVMIKPHLWLSGGVYTGSLSFNNEADWQTWENSYRDYILHFAKIGDSMHADILCIGTELGAVVKARPQYWQGLITAVKKIFSGKITYAANWNDYADFPFWEQLDYIGVDAYFPLSEKATPSNENLKKGWASQTGALEELSRRHNRPVLFTELGYRNVDYAGARPWEEKVGARNDPAQSACYDAFFETFSGKKWFAGVYFWKWYAGEGRRRRSDIGYTPQGKPALDRIEKWYSNESNN